ncbi:MAG TPA: MFS transporter [Candidatus Polarisedimenticolia bacterium]|nr:MFS transporter [Candidatus Polarisedimenticolia bacterium]
MYARLLRDPRFAKLLAGQSISELGSAVTQIALPTIAVLVLHAGPFELGILIALQRIPFPILALFVGVWIDRLPRRRVMIVADLLRAATLAAVPISYGTGFLGLPLLYAVSLVTGVLTIFFDLAYLSYVPELVERERLSDANATLQMSLSVANLAGPGLGGLLIQAVGAARAVGIDAASFVASFLSLLWMGPDKVRAERRPPPGMLKELREGLSHVFAHPLLRTLIITLGCVILFGHVLEPNLYPFVYSTLHLSPATLGWILSVEGAGAVVGAYFSPRIIGRVSAGWILAVTGVMTGAAFIVVSFAGAGPTILILGGALIVNGLLDPIHNVTQWSLRQLLTPDHLQGRMNSIFRTVYWGAWPLGNLVGGYLGSVFGPQKSIFLGGLLFGSLSLVFLLGPLRKASLTVSAVEAKIEPA